MHDQTKVYWLGSVALPVYGNACVLLSELLARSTGLLVAQRICDVATLYSESRFSSSSQDTTHHTRIALRLEGEQRAASPQANLPCHNALGAQATYYATRGSMFRGTSSLPISLSGPHMPTRFWTPRERKTPHHPCTTTAAPLPQVFRYLRRLRSGKISYTPICGHHHEPDFREPQDPQHSRAGTPEVCQSGPLRQGKGKALCAARSPVVLSLDYNIVGCSRLQL